MSLAPALPFAPRAAKGGDPAVVLGFPQNGPFTVRSARIRSQGTISGRDIYNERSVQRDIYAIRAVVRSGNSGGPLLTGDGEVAGVVFARADGDDTRGYAMTNAELEPVAAGAPGLSDRVSTGNCLG